MANNLPGGDALANQLAHNVADGAAHNQATIDQLQHSLAEGQANIMNSLASNQASLDAGWAQEAQRAQGLDAVFNSLNGPTPGIVPGLTPGFENAGPQMGMPGMEMPGMGMPPGGMTVSDCSTGRKWPWRARR